MQVASIPPWLFPVSKLEDEDVRAFDALYEHILKMADALSDGIIKQFPAKFATP